jgi:protease-4
MKFLLNGLQGREALLIEPSKAKAHAELSEKFGFTDMLSQLFVQAPAAYITEDGMGVVPIVGVIGKGLTPMEKMMGSCDLNDISMTLDAMKADPAVKCIALQVSSPGGTVTGVEEVANQVRAMGKPTMAYTDSEMASAAYWIGSAADRVVAAPSSTVGSVGVYMNLVDLSKAYDMAGAKSILIKSGIYKGVGAEGTTMTAEQMSNLQAGVDAIHADFKAAVNMKRSMVKADAMEGQTFSGKQAAQNGMVTGLADNFNQAVQTFNPGTGYNPNQNTMMKGKKAKALSGIKADMGEMENGPVLTPRQNAISDELCDIVETFGQFDQTSGPDGAHYAAPSPFADKGLMCQNCVFYCGGRACELVKGDIDPAAVCKLWVIPANLVKE